MPPDLALLSTLIGSNYPCLEQIFMVLKMFEPLKFDCICQKHGKIVTYDHQHFFYYLEPCFVLIAEINFVLYQQVSYLFYLKPRNFDTADIKDLHCISSKFISFAFNW